MLTYLQPSLKSVNYIKKQMVMEFMVCKVKLNDSFWKHFELDLQEIKLA